MYNLTALNNTNGNIFQYFDLANAVTENWFGVGALIVFFSVIFISLKQYGNKEAIITATVSTWILSMLFVFAKIVDGSVMYVTWSLLAAVALYAYVKRQS